MLRFAPSPTGDMHIGNLRAALFNYIVSRQLKKDFLIRIEDTDTERNLDGKDKDIFNMLAKFGITYEHTQIQSQNKSAHDRAIKLLLDSGRAFKCYCSIDELEKKKADAIKEKRAYRYDGKCVSAQERIGGPFVVRMKKPGGPIELADEIKGRTKFTPDDIDSYVVIREDGSPVYNFACAVDDMNSKITMIIRGEDHLSNTPKQIHIQRGLGKMDTIVYAHLPIIINEEGKKMSKRDNSSSVKWLLSEGFLPEAITNYMILMGNNPPKEIFTLSEALEFFDIKQISSSHARFDINKLRFVNREHIRMMTVSEVIERAGIKHSGCEDIVELYKAQSNTLDDLVERVNTFYSKRVIDGNYIHGFEKIKEFIKNVEYEDDFEKFRDAVIKGTGLKGKELFKPLRIFLSGYEHGEEIQEVYNAVKRQLKRIS